MATLHLMVGLPGAGKTTTARALAEQHRALRLTPDEWMIPLFDDNDAGGMRDVLEGRFVTTALQLLRLGVDVVLDFGLWSRDERAALHHLAAGAGAGCRSVYLPVGAEEQWRRVQGRAGTVGSSTFAMTRADLDEWRLRFEPPDEAELAGGAPARPLPQGCASWEAWATARWPSLVVSGP
ncbi:ATP-binding protein [Streptomyces sp. NP160]|uniref:AAA family ATPase n=1 Tax=Streptomyces sp. NP160 TaxID=2586637 RepID=UPI001119F90F|nr:ATP-binding protein [Streptomyces sp. NP160]TNM67087.1 ATP-binding protein [Streptomyces sp. NP160]